MKWNYKKIIRKCVYKPIKKCVAVFQNKVISLFKINSPED